MKIQSTQLQVKQKGIITKTNFVNYNQQNNHGISSTGEDLKISFSQEGLILSKLFKQFYEEYHSVEAIEQRQREQLAEAEAYNRLEDEFSLTVKYNFPENTLHQTIKVALEGKVVNASLYASELASAIRSSVSMPDKSAEERAAYREMALKQAQYISDNYFDNEQEASSFMNEINKYYENDVLREKGYIVIDNGNIKPFKTYSSPISNKNEVSFYTLAKRYMDKDYFERFINGEGTPEESAKFLMQLNNNREKYTEAILSESEREEQQAVAAINNAKSTLEALEWEHGRNIRTIEGQPSYLNNVLKWNNQMLNLFI